jgi:hypothetical protein
VTEEFDRIPPSRRALIAEGIKDVRACKQALHAVIEVVGAAEVCSSCRGECCRTGKYHFMVLDLLAYLAAGRELFNPRFDQEGCPFLGANGCLMEPSLRPFNCITFNCDRVESLIAPQERKRFVCLEQELRDCGRRLEELCGLHVRGGLMMSQERTLSGGEPIA